VEVKRCAYVVDDDPGIRRTISRILDRAGMHAEEFESAECFLSGYSERPCGCVLLDVRLPGMDGLELLDRISALPPANPVIMLSGYGDIPSAVRAVKTGALDFLQKPFAKDELLRIVERAFDEIEARVAGNENMADLTPRERDVLLAFSDGAPNKIVAARLDLSPRTIEMHRARIFKKLGVTNLSQALFRARDARLIE